MTTAIARLADEARHPLPESVVPDTSSGSDTRVVSDVAAVVGALALLAVAVLLIVRGRRRTATP